MNWFFKIVFDLDKKRMQNDMLWIQTDLNQVGSVLKKTVNKLHNVTKCDGFTST